MKKIIAFQKVFLHSTPALSYQPAQVVTSLAIWLAGVIMLSHLFAGRTLTSQTFGPIMVSVISVWMVNRNFNGNLRLFEIPPVSQRFTVYNVYLASVVIIILSVLGFWAIFLAFMALIAMIVLITQPGNLGVNPPEFSPEAGIDTLQGELLMLLVLILIVVIGTTIVFIKSSRARNLAFACLYIVGYSLLYTLKRFMPVSPETGHVEFLESFALMPEAVTINIALGLTTAIIIPICLAIGHRLYKSRLSPKQP